MARQAREIVGRDGEAIVRFWVEVMNDATARVRDRLEASKLLAERGWGKTATFHIVDEDDDALGRDETADPRLPSVSGSWS